LGDEIKKYVKGGRGHIWETEEVETVFAWIKLGDSDYLEDLGLYGTITLKWIFRLIHIIHMTSGQKNGKN
jgi:hypothetical protein